MVKFYDYICKLFKLLVVCPVISDYVVTREGWGGKPPKSTHDIVLPVHFVIIHHTYIPDVCNTTGKCKNSVQGIQRFHQDVRKWDDIGYNFLIGGDGLIYEGRGWTHVGAHALHWNSKSIGISLIGDFTDKNPSEIMMLRAQQLIEYGISNNYITKDYILYGHRQVGVTECPGNMFYETLKTWPHWDSKVEKVNRHKQ